MGNPVRNRPQTLGEEIANAISHGLGLLLAIASLPILAWYVGREGTAVDVAAVSVFAGTMILLYLVSTLYHALPASRVKAWFQRFDHAAIDLFIAGSYTPFTFGVLRGAWGLTLAGIVGTAAAVGASLKLLDRLRHPLWSTALYVAMGWAALVAAVPLAQRMADGGLVWLAVGGLSYTLGAIVFLFDDRRRYLHFVWHLFVIAGSTCHFCAVLWYARG